MVVGVLLAENTQDRGSDYGGFEGVESGLAWCCPMEIVFFGEFREGLGDVGDEPAVVICLSEKRLDVLEVRWDGPFYYGGDFGGIHSDSVLRDDVTEVGQGLFEELALRQFGVELVVTKLVEGPPEMLKVIRLGPREDEDIVQVDDDELVGVGVEDVRHNTLEDSWALVKPKVITVNS